jgi:PAS domain S-box-containing protein
LSSSCPDIGPGKARPWGILLGLTLLYILSAKLGLSFAFLHASATPIWPPTGIAFASLLLLGPAAWPIVFAGAFIANVTTAGSVATSLGIAIGNTAEALLGAGLVRRFARGAHAFERAQDIFKFAALAAAVSTSVSATIGVSSLALGGFASWSAYRSLWLTWWLGDATGALLVTPLLLLGIHGPALPALRRQAAELIALLLATLALGLAVFGSLLPAGMANAPIGFACIPPLLWAAFRFSPRETAGLIAVLAGVAVEGTLRGSGPFALATPNASLLLLQGFMAIMALTMLPLAAVVWERKGTTEALRQALAGQERLLGEYQQAELATRESEQRLHGIVSAAMDAILTVDGAQRVVVFNAAAERMFGCAAAEAIGRPLDRFIPPRVREAHRRHIQGFDRHGATARRMGALGELTGVRASGEEFPIEASISRTEAGGKKLFTVILRDITERKQVEQRLRQTLADKDTLLRELNHRVKNNFQMLSDLLYLQAGSLQSREAQQSLHETCGRLLAIARLHEELYQSLGSGEIRLAEYLGRLVEGFESVYAGLPIRLDVGANGVTLDVDRAIHTGLIVNELVTNAVKHAFADATPGDITVRLRARGEHLELQVRDTGKGLPPGFDLARTNSFGLRIVRVLTERLGATTSVESGSSGTAFTITFPARDHA